MSAAAHWLGGAASRDYVTVLPGGSDRPAGGARSYLADGRLVSWAPPGHPDLRWAIDAELADQPVPPALARRCGCADPALFWPCWTRAEVSAKLLDIPILVWVRRYGLAPDAGDGAGRGPDYGVLALRTSGHEGLVVTYGARLSVGQVAQEAFDLEHDVGRQCTQHHATDHAGHGTQRVGDGTSGPEARRVAGVAQRPFELSHP